MLCSHCWRLASNTINSPDFQLYKWTCADACVCMLLGASAFVYNFAALPLCHVIQESFHIRCATCAAWNMPQINTIHSSTDNLISVVFPLPQPPLLHFQTLLTIITCVCVCVHSLCEYLINIMWVQPMLLVHGCWQRCKGFEGMWIDQKLHIFFNPFVESFNFYKIMEYILRPTHVFVQLY